MCVYFVTKTLRIHAAIHMITAYTCLTSIVNLMFIAASSLMRYMNTYGTATVAQPLLVSQRRHTIFIRLFVVTPPRAGLDVLLLTGDGLNNEPHNVQTDVV